MDKIYDVFTVGAGPAGLTAALYCRRAEKSVIIAEKEVAGGQVTHSPKIENYPGSAQMSGLDFAERLVAQVKEHGAELVEDEVTALHRGDDGLWTVSLAALLSRQAFITERSDSPARMSVRVPAFPIARSATAHSIAA